MSAKVLYLNRATDNVDLSTAAAVERRRRKPGRPNKDIVNYYRAYVAVVGSAFCNSVYKTTSKRLEGSCLEGSPSVIAKATLKYRDQILREISGSSKDSNPIEELKACLLETDILLKQIDRQFKNHY